MTSGFEGHRKRLRERFINSGLEGFHDHEVLELLLIHAIPRRDVKPIAKALLSEFKSLAAVFDAPLSMLQNIDGVGLGASVLIKLIPALLVRYQQDRWKQTRSFRSVDQAVEFLYPLLGFEREEIFCVLALNSSNELIAVEKIQRGSVNRTAVFPRLVVETALKHRATALILAHNHPGGNPTPSEADIKMTHKLLNVLRDLDITVHDHIIIAGPKSYSFAKHGHLQDPPET